MLKYCCLGSHLQDWYQCSMWPPGGAAVQFLGPCLSLNQSEKTNKPRKPPFPSQALLPLLLSRGQIYSLGQPGTHCVNQVSNLLRSTTLCLCLLNAGIKNINIYYTSSLCRGGEASHSVAQAGSELYVAKAGCDPPYTTPQ